MELDDQLKAFFERPLMCIIGTADHARRPSIGRGVGFRAHSPAKRIEVIFSAWQWPQLAADIRATGRMAVTFVSPVDYVSFQIKGPASLRPTEDADLIAADAFIARISAELVRLGVPATLIGPWLTSRDACVAVLDIAEIYIQTPGPQAGMTA